MKKEEIGWSKIFLTKDGINDPLFKRIESLFMFSNGIRILLKCLKNGMFVATSDHCKNQAFRISEIIWGLQFHIEKKIETGRRWKNFCKEEINLKNIERKYNEIREIFEKVREIILENFIKTGIKYSEGKY